MPITKLRPSFTLTEDRLAELKAVVPEAFAGDKVNWETLREALGEHLEDAGPDAEHFGLFWPGKREARRLAAKPSKGALIPAPGEGVDEATTRNLFIEGDNLEVLKLLQKSYAGRVKMIYIDPPYNTGNDFVYSDNFADPLDDYLRKTGQMGEEGEMLTSNPKAGGRFHSNWLSMMYPRLLLARRLLREDGVIFISIDDNEIASLRLLLDEVFGSENFVASLIWQKMDSPSRNDVSRAVSNYHDYILVFAANQNEMLIQSKSQESILDAYPLTLADGRLARRRQLRKNGKGARRVDRPTLWYPLTAPDGSVVLPIAPEGWEGRWVLSPDTWEERTKAGLTEWIKRDEGWTPYYIEIAPSDPRVPWSTLWTEVDQNRQAKAEFTSLMGSSVDFDNPKPTSLLTDILSMSSTTDDICLDFFAGSGTTAHAVLQQNCQDGGNRRFILVQLPEPTDNPKFPTIAEIGKERMRRVIKHMRADNSRAQTAIPLDGNRQSEIENPKSEDLGFKVFKLGRSSYKGWQDYEGDDVSQLETLFDAHESPLVKGWKPEHLLAETMLIEGFPLDSVVTPQTQFARNRVACVESDACAHRLFACFNDAIDDDTVAELRSGKNLREDDVFICLDSALSDEAKLRLSDAVKVHVI